MLYNIIRRYEYYITSLGQSPIDNIIPIIHIINEQHGSAGLGLEHIIRVPLYYIIFVTL